MCGISLEKSDSLHNDIFLCNNNGNGDGNGDGNDDWQIMRVSYDSIMTDAFIYGIIIG